MGPSPSHEQLALDNNIAFNGNSMLHVPNHIDCKPSGHWIMRNLLIDIITERKPDPMKFGYDLCKLTPELVNELRMMLQELNIKFKFDVENFKASKFHDYETKNEVNAESGRKWLIEKKYLFFWLNKARNKELQIDKSKCVMPIADPNAVMFVTDGERIATIYLERHM